VTARLMPRDAAGLRDYLASHTMEDSASVRQLATTIAATIEAAVAEERARMQAHLDQLFARLTRVEAERDELAVMVSAPGGTFQ
jgi:ABC-type Zn2+ transport system substrate-binding protein/surface adhesin